VWEEGGCSRLADRSAYRGEFVSLQGQIEHLPGGYLRECALGPGGEVREQGRSARAEGVCVPGFDAAAFCLRLTEANSPFCKGKSNIFQEGT